MLIGGGLEKDGMHHMVNTTRGIITLYRHQKAAFAITSKRGPAPKAPKAPSTDLPPGSILSTDNDEVQKNKNNPHIYSKQLFPLARLLLFVCLEQEAVSDSEKRRGAVFDDCCPTLRLWPYRVSAVPLGEHDRTAESRCDGKPERWYVDGVATGTSSCLSREETNTLML